MVLSEALACLRADGPSACRHLLESRRCDADSSRDRPLLQELLSRLRGEPAPRLLVDGVWLSRVSGGITRVWEQIFGTWSLPGLLPEPASLRVIDREATSALLSRFPVIERPALDPLDLEGVEATANANAALAVELGADVFLSTWISVCGAQRPACTELALVHDCMPERSRPQAPLLRMRRRWLLGAGAHLAVSAATASDLEGLLQRPAGSVPWEHPAPASCFAQHPITPAAERLWSQLQVSFGLRQPFVLLPSSSSIGSYKNPELVARALLDPALEQIQLVLCGPAAHRHACTLEQAFPPLTGRLRSASFTDLQLAELYRRALAVLQPSRVEGFGLPVVEALAAGGIVLAADARGLREAGGGAVPRVDAESPAVMSAWLRLLLDPASQAWITPHLHRRRRDRLHQLQPDRLGLALLAEARRISALQPAS